MSKSTNGLRKAGLASLAVTLTLGAGAMGAGSASALPGFSFDRIGGDNRYETSALIADEYEEGPIADVILANAQPGFYADALTANYLSGEMDAPILLTRKEFTPEPVLAQLEEDDVENITVVGGEGVVPEAQVEALEAEGYNVTRISGTDRFLTNAEVIEAGGAATNGVGIIATGFNFPDALAAGPISYQGHPLGLSTEDDIDDEVITALKGAGVTKVLIMGGASAVGQAVVDKLEDNGITVLQRFAGADRSETSELAAEWALANLGFSNKHVGVASGYTEGYGADALAGGPLEGMEKSPMLITRNVDNPDNDVLEYLEKHSSTLVDGHLYGGPAAISVAAEAAMEAAAQGTAPAGVTDRPELVDAEVVRTFTNNAGTLGTSDDYDQTEVLYTFDEEVTGQTPAQALFHLVDFDGARADGQKAVLQSDNKSVLVTFGTSASEMDAAALEDVSLATVDQDAVSDVAGNDNPIGDQSIGDGRTNTTGAAGVTDGPDLQSVSNRSAEVANEFTVDFTFDEKIEEIVTDNTDAGDTYDFVLVFTDGNNVACSPEEATGDRATADQDATVTVLCNANDGQTPTGDSADVSNSTIARGFVVAGSVEDADDNANVDQASNTPDSASATPDLETVTFDISEGTGADTAVYDFDAAVKLGLNGNTAFFVYEADGTEVANGTAARSTTDASQIVVTFPNGTLDDAVGAGVQYNAVQALSDSTPNYGDEVGVANIDTTTSEAGETEGPDLTGVKVESDGDAVYTFDEDVASVVSPAEFKLYLANGRELVCSDASPAVPTNTTAGTNNTVTCDTFTVTGFGTATDEQVAAAVLGTVDDGAVTDGATGNPEGAAATTQG